MKALSSRFLEIAPSMTLAITAKAKQMKADGVDVVSFGAGEPDFNTPEYIRKAAIERIHAGGIGYTEASGLHAFRQAISKKFKVDNGLVYAPEQIVVSSGAKHSLFNALSALCNPGDEVIVPTPYWVSYYELVKMVGATPVIVRGAEQNRFKITGQDLASAVTPKTKAIILNTPNNPTGAVYSREELKALGDVASANDLYIIADEIYEKLVYGVSHVSIAALSEDLYARTITVNGLSKAYAMTGWRIGFTGSSVQIAKVMGNIQSHATSNANTIAQYAGIEALTGDQSAIEAMRRAFDERRQYMVNTVSEIPGLRCVDPQGAFYVMVHIGAFVGKTVYGQQIAGSLDFAAVLLEQAKVAVIPGIAFGADHYIRLSYAADMKAIETGLRRIGDFCRDSGVIK